MLGAGDPADSDGPVDSARGSAHEEEQAVNSSILRGGQYRGVGSAGSGFSGG